MEFCRLADPMLQRRASPVFSFLLPSIRLSRCANRTTQAPIALRQPSRRLCRSFHSVFPLRAESYSSSAADLESLEDYPQPHNPRGRPSASRQEDENEKQIDALFNSTFRRPSATRKRFNELEKETSASILENSYKASEYYNMRDRGARTPGAIARSMNFSDPAASNTPGESSARMSNINQFQVAKRAKRTIRSRPAVGRTVEINLERDMDLGRALRTLEMQCAVNRVRSDLARQRFHERPGIKRKRLKSERWRKLFRESFRTTVGRVKQMRRKGW
ncbi:hypothetical protein ACLMJK_005157 [Lecanora helva]